MDKNKQFRVLFFRWGVRVFGIEIKDIREIIKYANARPVPMAPPYVNRIINVRGRIITVFFLNRVFNIRENANDPESRVLILGSGEIQAGIYADSISGIQLLNPTSLHSVPESMSKNKARMFFKGELETPGTQQKIPLFEIEAITKFLKEVKL